MKKALVLAVFVLGFSPVVYAGFFDWFSSSDPIVGDASGIGTLDQWTSTSSPSSGITQRTYGKAIRFTGAGLASCDTIDTDANGYLSCGTDGGGGGGAFAWTVRSYGNSTSTVLGFLAGFFSTASSTIDANLLITGNSTTTSATTTNSFATTASSTNFYGAALATCQSNNVLTWAGGKFGCEADDSGSGSSAFEIATTSDIAVSQLSYINQTSGRTTIASVATGTISVGSSALTLSATRYAVGGALAIDCATASGSQNGCLSSTNWTTFNSKLGVYDAWTHPAAGISATTSNILITASSTIGSGLQIGGLTIDGGATTTGFLTVQGTSASSTFAAGISATQANFTGSATNTFAGGLSTASLKVSGLNTCDTINTDSAGNLLCGTDASGAGGAFPFDSTTNFNQTANSTTTAIWFQAQPFSLMASSTAVFDGINSRFATTTYASSTALTSVDANITGTLDVDNLTSAIVLTGATGIFAEYTGSGTCTNQFVTVLSALGVATCASVDISAMTNLTSTWPIILTGDNLTFGGLSTSTAAVTGNIPYFSGVNTFANVATGTISSSGGITTTASRYAINGALAISCDVATASAAGCLAAADFTTFNTGTSKWATTTALDSIYVNAGLATKVGIGTTTPRWGLQIATSTGIGTSPQLALTDMNAATNFKHWTLRSTGGYLYLATSSDALATSTVPVLTFTPNTGVLSVTTGATSTFTPGISATAINLTGSATSTFTGGISAASLKVAGLNTCDTIDTDSSGNLKCGTDGGGTSDNDHFATTTDNKNNIYVNGGLATLVGIGTTTPRFGLQIATTSSVGSSPQLALTDMTAGTNLKHWTFTSQGGNLYIATSSDALATSTTAALEVRGSGRPALSIGSSTPFATLAVNPEAGGFSNQFVVGSSSATNFRISNGGKIFVPNISAGAAGDTDACLNATTNELTDAGATACVVSSIRYKENLEPLTECLLKVQKLNAIGFNYKPELDSSLVKGTKRVGLIAEDMLKIEPRLVTFEPDGVTPRGIDYESYTALLTCAIQELAEKPTDQKPWVWILLGLLTLLVGWSQVQLWVIKR